jgi:TolB-like protein/Tfp pilus assembly protein PilF
VIGLLARLRRRKLVQWSLAYAAFAFALLQVVDIVAQRFGWPEWIERVLILALAVGFCIALVLAWYHGERGAQEIRGTEIAIVALLLAIGGGLLWNFERGMPANGATPAPPPAPAPAPAAAPAAAKSVAVLPFVNMSGDPRNDYFSDGITEEILNALAQVPGLKVAARTSAFAFKGKDVDLRKVGQVLGVATVLEGSVQRVGDDVRITAQLIDTRSGYHLWSEKYDRKLTSIFAVEDEISGAIAERLEVQWSRPRAGARRERVDPRAHDAYLRGLTLFARRSMPEAVDAFDQAVRFDPGYAEAWASLAEARAILPTYADVPMQSTGEAALHAARQALSLDPGLPLAYVAQGIVFLNQMRWAEADDAFRRAVAVAPGDAEAINQYAQFLYAAGQLEPALAEIDRSLRHDPLSGPSGAIRAQLLSALHRPAEANAQIRRTLAMHPEGLLEHRVAFWIYAAQGDYGEGGRHLRIASTLMDGRPDLIDRLVEGMTDPAMRPAAIRILETDPALASLRRDGVVRAAFLMALDDRDGAFAALEDFAGNGGSTTPQLLWYPVFDPVRADPRFRAVLERTGLPFAAAKPDSR